jgi:hypothetical protein
MVGALAGCTSPTVTPTRTITAPVTAPSAATPTPTVTVTATPTPTVVAPSATPTATPVASKKSVTPFITTASYSSSKKAISASAIISDVLESGGTCTLTATHGGTTKTATSKGVAASSYTACEPLSLSGSLAAGTWSVTVAYASTKAVGTSAAKSVTVAG